MAAGRNTGTKKEKEMGRVVIALTGTETRRMVTPWRRLVVSVLSTIGTMSPGTGTQTRRSVASGLYTAGTRKTRTAWMGPAAVPLVTTDTRRACPPYARDAAFVFMSTTRMGTRDK